MYRAVSGNSMTGTTAAAMQEAGVSAAVMPSTVMPMPYTPAHAMGQRYAMMTADGRPAMLYYMPANASGTQSSSSPGSLFPSPPGTFISTAPASPWFASAPAGGVPSAPANRANPGWTTANPKEGSEAALPPSCGDAATTYPNYPQGLPPTSALPPPPCRPATRATTTTATAPSLLAGANANADGSLTGLVNANGSASSRGVGGGAASAAGAGGAPLPSSAPPTSPTPPYPGYQMAIPLPLRTSTALQQQPQPQQQQQQQQTCFLVNRTTGALTPIRMEDVMTISGVGTNSTLPSYAIPPLSTTAAGPLPMLPASALSGPSPSASTTSYSTYVLSPSQMAPLGATSVIPAFSASLSGTNSLIVSAFSPPPPASLPAQPKSLNGLQYQLGELYEGFVKRYNPNRGFGFLTATHHVTKLEDHSGSPTGSPSASQSSPAAAPDTAKKARERRTPVHLGDIFVHQSYMHMQGFRTLPVGGRVRFRIGYKDGQQTFQAVEVELLPQVPPPHSEMGGSLSTAVLSTSKRTVSSDAPMEESQGMTPFSDPPSNVIMTATQQHSLLTSEEMAHANADLLHQLFFPAVNRRGNADAVGGPGSCGREERRRGEEEEEDDDDDLPLIELAYDLYGEVE